MTLKEIELFYQLCENPHVSQLSKKLTISQSAISLAIKSLERKLGEPLFDRLGKKLVLNERGRVFKDKTYKSFLALKDAENIFKKDQFAGALHVASSKTIGNFIMPQIVFDFLSSHQNITIKNEIKNSSQIIQMLKDGKLDMGFIESDCDESELSREIMGEDELVIVSCDKSLKDEVYIDELFEKKWILREKGSGTREVFLKSIGDLSKDIKIFMEYFDFEEVKRLLQANPEVVTCISKLVLQDDLREIRLKNITIKRNFYCIFNKNKYRSKLFESFKQFAKSGFF
ncbi:MAG: LysR family transcriptional regulator [Sulfurimonas sp.]|nr:LysR family transcriptional regulator [Sulfurimonas sp.]